MLNDKTKREEAAYLAGRLDAQLLCNLYFAGTKVKAPILTEQDMTPLMEKVRRMEGALKISIQRQRNAERFAAQMADSLSYGQAKTKRQKRALRQFRGSNCFEMIIQKYGETKGQLGDF